MPTFHNHAGKNSILNTLPVDEIEEGRHDIYEWSKKRTSKRRGIRGTLYRLKKLFIDKNIIKSFLLNLTPIIILQMVLAGLFTYACQTWGLLFDVQMAILISPIIFPLSFSINGLSFDVQMTMLVSPIIFPLAFSINADFQRREKVLEDLALFKGALMILFFSHRDWLPASGLPQEFLKAVTKKLKELIVNIKEYLLTEKESRRNFILKVIYEDFSDIGQLNDKVRASNLPSNSPLVTRLIHYHNLMCWAFERLRVVREYRSPRSIRSFTKVFISLMPLLLSPYYVYIGQYTGNPWAAYYVAIIVSFVFGTLQGVQDKLDDPFDGISEDDINLGQLEDWTLHSLLQNRTVTMGRFTVTTNVPDTTSTEVNETAHVPVKIAERRRSSFRRESKARIPSILKPQRQESIRVPTDDTDPDLYKTEMQHLYPEMAHRLQNMTEKGLTGSTTILPGYHMKEKPTALPVNSSGASLDSIPQEDWPKRQLDRRKSDSKKFVSFFKEPPSPIEELSDENVTSPPEGTLPRKNPVEWVLGGESGPNSNSSTVNMDDLPEGLRKVLQGLKNTSGTDFVHRGQEIVKAEPCASGKTPASLAGLFEGPLAVTTPVSKDSDLNMSEVEVDLIRSSKQKSENSKSPGDVCDSTDGLCDNTDVTPEESQPPSGVQTPEGPCFDYFKRKKGKQFVDCKPRRKLSASNRVSPLVDRRDSTSNATQVSPDAPEHKTISETTHAPSTANTTFTPSSSPPSSSSPGSPLVDTSQPTAIPSSMSAQFVSSTPSKYGAQPGPSPDVSPLATPAPTNNIPTLFPSPAMSSHKGAVLSVDVAQTSSVVPSSQNSALSNPPDLNISSLNSGGDSHASKSNDRSSVKCPDSEPNSSLIPPDSAQVSSTQGESTFSSPTSRFSVTRCPSPVPGLSQSSGSSEHKTDSLHTQLPSDNALPPPGRSNTSSRFNVTSVSSPSSALDDTAAPSDYGQRLTDLANKADVKQDCSSMPRADRSTREQSSGSDYSQEDTRNLLRRDRFSSSSSDNDTNPCEARPMIKKTSLEHLILSDADKHEVFI